MPRAISLKLLHKCEQATEVRRISNSYSSQVSSSVVVNADQDYTKLGMTLSAHCVPKRRGSMLSSILHAPEQPTV